jgi:hypothetical protein
LQDKVPMQRLDSSVKNAYNKGRKGVTDERLPPVLWELPRQAWERGRGNFLCKKLLQRITSSGFGGSDEVILYIFQMCKSVLQSNGAAGGSGSSKFSKCHSVASTTKLACHPEERSDVRIRFLRPFCTSFRLIRHCHKEKRILTPVCGLAQNDRGNRNSPPQNSC